MGNKLQNLRALHSDFARSYKYEFVITKPPAVLLPALQTDELKNSCLSCIIPSTGVQLIETEVGTHTLKLNGREEEGGAINPEFIISGSYSIYKYFRAWKNYATPDMISEVQSPSADLLATIQIRAKNIKNEGALTVELMHAWTRLAPEHTFSDESNDIVRWAPEIVYELSREID